MTALPIATDITGSTLDEAQVKTALASQREFLAELLGTTGAQKDALSALGSLAGAGCLVKIGAYTVASSDRGKVINCTSGTFTLTVTAAATLGDGFAFGVKNSGTGTVTINPNGSELIDGVASVDLLPGESCLVVCNGTAFVSFGRKISLKTINGSSIEGTGNLVISEGADITYTEIRSMMFCKSTATVSAGGTVSGSSLYPATILYGGDIYASSTALSGTWRARCNISTVGLAHSAMGLFERIS